MSWSGFAIPDCLTSSAMSHKTNMDGVRVFLREDEHKAPGEPDWKYPFYAGVASFDEAATRGNSGYPLFKLRELRPCNAEGKFVAKQDFDCSTYNYGEVSRPLSLIRLMSVLCRSSSSTSALRRRERWPRRPSPRPRPARPRPRPRPRRTTGLGHVLLLRRLARLRRTRSRSLQGKLHAIYLFNDHMDLLQGVEDAGRDARVRGGSSQREKVV